MVVFKVTTKNSTITLEDEQRGFWISFQDEELAATLAPEIEETAKSLAPSHLWQRANFTRWSKGAHVVTVQPMADSEQGHFKAQLSDNRYIQAGRSRESKSAVQDPDDVKKWLQIIGLVK